MNGGGEGKTVVLGASGSQWREIWKLVERSPHRVLESRFLSYVVGWYKVLTISVLPDFNKL